jgi:hypothetical protein
MSPLHCHHCQHSALSPRHCQHSALSPVPQSPLSLAVTAVITATTVTTDHCSPIVVYAVMRSPVQHFDDLSQQPFMWRAYVFWFVVGHVLLPKNSDTHSKKKTTCIQSPITRPQPELPKTYSGCTCVSRGSVGWDKLPYAHSAKAQTFSGTFPSKYFVFISADASKFLTLGVAPQSPPSHYHQCHHCTAITPSPLSPLTTRCFLVKSDERCSLVIVFGTLPTMFICNCILDTTEATPLRTLRWLWNCE